MQTKKKLPDLICQKVILSNLMACSSLLVASFWTAEEVDLSKDKDDWASLTVSILS